MTTEFTDLQRALRENLKLRRELGVKAAKGRDKLVAERQEVFAKLAKEMEADIAEIQSRAAAAEYNGRNTARKIVFWTAFLFCGVGAFVVSWIVQ